MAVDIADNTLSVQLQQSSPIPLAVNFHCESGQLLALYGPSGSGKSTVLRSVAGLYKTPSGQVLCGDRLWQDSEQSVFKKARSRSVGLVFQDYALFPHLSALENVLTATHHLHGQQRQKIALEMLARVNMTGLETRYPSQLSGGQQQRVALARALARQPQVLLLDEPFSSVDQQTRSRLYRELAQLRRDLSIPIILVSHDLNEVLQLADAISLIHHGRTIQSGPLRDVLERPDSIESARLLGSSNLFDARILPQLKENKTRVFALGQELLVAGHPYPADRQLTLLVPSAAIILHRQDKPSRGERENPIACVVSDYVALGDEVLLRVVADLDLQSSLSFKVSKHVAERNSVAIGKSIGISLVASSLHLIDETGLGAGKRR